MGTIDHAEFVHKGVTFRLDIEPDTDANPNDYDGYDEVDKARFRAGAWSYVGMTLTPIIDGYLRSDVEGSLWSVEYGTNGDRWDITTADLVKRAIDEGMCDEVLGKLETVDKAAGSDRIVKMLDLSTGNLPEKMMEDLTSFDGVTARTLGEFAVLLWVPADPAEYAADYADFPAEVLHIQQYARERGCDYVMFDPDAEVNPNLPHWVW